MVFSVTGSSQGAGEKAAPRSLYLHVYQTEGEPGTVWHVSTSKQARSKPCEEEKELWSTTPSSYLPCGLYSGIFRSDTNPIASALPYQERQSSGHCKVTAITGSAPSFLFSGETPTALPRETSAPLALLAHKYLSTTLDLQNLFSLHQPLHLHQLVSSSLSFGFFQSQQIVPS